MSSRELGDSPFSEPGRNGLSEESLSAIVAEHQSGLLRYARQVLGGDASRAEDAVQEAFCALVRQPDPAATLDSVAAWLYRVTRNRALDMIRKESRMKHREGQVAVAEPIAPDESFEIAERDREIQRVLETLDPSLREVLVLKTQGNLSYREIARVTDTSLATVSQLVHRGLAAVARGLRAADVL